jgi:hypothetical protein
VVGSLDTPKNHGDKTNWFISILKNLNFFLKLSLNYFLQYIINKLKYTVTKYIFYNKINTYLHKNDIINILYKIISWAIIFIININNFIHIINKL